MSVSTRLARPVDLDAALRVWHEANLARSKVPSQEHFARVCTKLADRAALLIVAVDGGELVGMALAEPGRDDDGAGQPLPKLCHISMVFVHPDHWGKAIGQHLLTAVATYAAKQGYSRLQLWTGQSKERAQRLYRRAGFELSGRTQKLDSGELVLHLTRSVA
jgi:ribosomal protein S18 acetylase RimI-like enzyme